MQLIYKAKRKIASYYDSLDADVQGALTRVWKLFFLMKSNIQSNPINQINHLLELKKYL
jgi:hypothetical protein